MDEFSASLWIMDTQGTANGVAAGIDFTVSPHQKDYVWSIYYGPDTRQFWARVHHPDASWVTVNGKFFPLNQWQHLVVTFKKNSHLTLYQNGVLVGQEATQNAGAVAGTAISAGIGGTVGSAIKDCILDEVRFYDRALTAAEVMMLYKSTQPKGTAGVSAATFSPPRRFGK